MQRFEIIEKQTCFQGFFRLERYRLKHTLFAGGWTGEVVRELFERGCAVAVLLYDPVNDAVVLTEQFRIGAISAPGGPWLLELVAGMIEAGEQQEAVAHRETFEETGCKLLDLEPICEYLVSPGGTSERITLFCGRVDATLAGGIHGLAEEHEDIKVTVMAYNQVMQCLHNRQINSANPIIALQWLALNRDRLRRQWGTVE